MAACGCLVWSTPQPVLRCATFDEDTLRQSSWIVRISMRVCIAISLPRSPSWWTNARDVSARRPHRQRLAASARRTEALSRVDGFREERPGQTKPTPILLVWPRRLAHCTATARGLLPDQMAVVLSRQSDASNLTASRAASSCSVCQGRNPDGKKSGDSATCCCSARAIG